MNASLFLIEMQKAAIKKKSKSIKKFQHSASTIIACKQQFDADEENMKLIMNENNFFRKENGELRFENIHMKARIKELEALLFEYELSKLT